MMEHVRVPSAPVSTSTHAKFKTVEAGAVVSGMVTNLVSGVQSGAVLASIENMHGRGEKQRDCEIKMKYNLIFFFKILVFTLRCKFWFW